MPRQLLLPLLANGNVNFVLKPFPPNNQHERSRQIMLKLVTLMVASSTYGLWMLYNCCWMHRNGRISRPQKLLHIQEPSLYVATYSLVRMIMLSLAHMRLTLLPSIVWRRPWLRAFRIQSGCELSFIGRVPSSCILWQIMTSIHRQGKAFQHVMQLMHTSCPVVILLKGVRLHGRLEDKQKKEIKAVVVPQKIQNWAKWLGGHEMSFIVASISSTYSIQFCDTNFTG